jgi:hypothetical protein
MYQGSTEDEEGDEALTEAVIGVASEVEEDTARTGATVAGTCCVCVSRQLNELTIADSGRGRGY